jgi:hypothetical protein
VGRDGIAMFDWAARMLGHRQCWIASGQPPSSTDLETVVQTSSFTCKQALGV